MESLRVAVRTSSSATPGDAFTGHGDVMDSSIARITATRSGVAQVRLKERISLCITDDVL